MDERTLHQKPMKYCLVTNITQLKKIQTLTVEIAGGFITISTFCEHTIRSVGRGEAFEPCLNIHLGTPPQAQCTNSRAEFS